ncbi:hypothetical protein AMTRI_Chr07g80530 [Amborella trichopoda]
MCKLGSIFEPFFLIRAHSTFEVATPTSNPIVVHSAPSCHVTFDLSCRLREESPAHKVEVVHIIEATTTEVMVDAPSEGMLVSLEIINMPVQSLVRLSFELLNSEEVNDEEAAEMADDACSKVTDVLASLALDIESPSLMCYLIPTLPLRPFS